MSNGIYYIYKITNLINKKIYIGFTSTTPEQRFKEHYYSSQRKNSHKCYIHKSMKKYGIENFIVETLEESNDRNYCLNVLEPYYIKLFNSNNHNIGYNLSFGGEGGNLSSESKLKLSQIKKDGYASGKYKSPNKGMNYEDFYGKEKSLLIRQKIKNNHIDCKGTNNSFYGKHHNEETKQNIKEKLSGKNNISSKSFVITDDENNIIFKGKGINQFAYDLGFNYPSYLKKCIKFHRPIKTKVNPKYNGYYIKYIEED